MREIIFRGKYLEDGNWVFGNLVVDDDKNVYIEARARYAVDPKTVGQYTGMVDKNGTRIFEDDIVRYGHNGSLRNTRYQVYLETCHRCGWYPFAKGDGCGCCEDEVECPEDCEVVGNMHDASDVEKAGVRV